MQLYLPNLPCTQMVYISGGWLIGVLFTLDPVVYLVLRRTAGIRVNFGPEVEAPSTILHFRLSLVCPQQD